MKYFLFLLIHFVFLVKLIGQKVETNGEIQISQSSNPSEAGAIRWSGNDFEGFNGSEWISLTNSNTNSDTSSNTNIGNQSFWGQPVLSSFEDYSFYAPDDNNWDHFGRALDFDGKFAVVSGFLNDVNGTDSGGVYVFEKINDNWEYRAKLLPSDSYAGHAFGYDVAISGNTIVVSAINDQSNQGAVYVFEMPESGWVDAAENAKLTASDGVAGDYFGWSIAIENSEIVVGSASDDLAAANVGSAYVFVEPESGWISAIETAKLKASDPFVGDSFGYSIDISSGVIVTGAPNKDNGAANGGALYIYEKPITGWVDTIETAQITANSPISLEYLGHSVSIDSNTIVTGTTGYGNVYVFEKDSSGWANTNESVKIVASDGIASDGFGWSVDIEGDAIVIGSPNKDNLTGSVYIVETDNGKWGNKLATMQLLGYQLKQADNLGYDVAIGGDMIMAGALKATGKNVIGTNVSSGKVLVYRRK